MKQNVEHYEYPVLDDASEILKSIDMPERLRNPRCVMTLAACAEMKPGGKWKYASENYHGTHEIIEFINANFPNKASLDIQGYKENSRETFRDETLKKWVSAGIMEEKPGLATNSKDNAYRFTSKFASLIRKFGSSSWKDALDAFLQTYESYSKILKQARELEPGYPVKIDGFTFELGRSAHNKLQMEVLDKFVKQFASGAKLLYIGDTADRKGHGRADLLRTRY